MGDSSGVESLPAQGEAPSTAPEGAKAGTFLGRPAVEVVLAPYIPSNKRARSEEAGDASGAAGGGGGGSSGSSRGAAPLGTLHSAVKSMQRAVRLGVRVPLVYWADPRVGRALVERVEGGRSLGELAAAHRAQQRQGGQGQGQQGEEGQQGQGGAQEGGSGADAPPSSAPAAAPAPPSPASDEVSEAELSRVASELGRQLALLHDSGQQHGGAGPGAVLVRAGDGAVFLDRWERSACSTMPLDKAEDLFAWEAVLREQVAAEGEQAERLAEKLQLSYREHSRYWSATHNKVAEVRARVQHQQQQQAAKRAKAEQQGKVAEGAKQ